MVEQTKDTATESPKPSEDGRNKYESTSLVESANRAAERLEAANKEMRENLARQEDLLARNRLGGMSTGAPAEEPKKEISPSEYIEKVKSGDIKMRE